MLTHFCTFQLGKKDMVVFDFQQMGDVQRHGGWFHEYHNFLFAQAVA
jgi:hypothetical protein